MEAARVTCLIAPGSNHGIFQCIRIISTVHSATAQRSGEGPASKGIGRQGWSERIDANAHTHGHGAQVTHTGQTAGQAASNAAITAQAAAPTSTPVSTETAAAAAAPADCASPAGVGANDVATR